METVEVINGRSPLSKADARKRYVEIGELVVLKQIQDDSAKLDDRAIAIGPFARLDASAAAAHDGKTRGAVTNLFGSQAAYQTETMALALSAIAWIEKIEYPSPDDFDTPDKWVDAFFSGQSDRGPQHGAEPTVNYAFLWALWLSTVPYGLWSEEISRTGLAEYRQWVAQLKDVFADALDHFDLAVGEGATVLDLASAAASLIEGIWLNQCLTVNHPSDPSEPVSAALRRSGRMLWRGATRPRAD